MLNPIARRLLEQHYMNLFQPLNDAPVAIRRNTPPGCPDLSVIRMLSRRPDGQLMQVLATIGASDYQMKPKPNSLTDRNEYITFVPADWDLSAPEHRWIVQLLEAVAQYPHEAKTMVTYAHTLDLTALMDELQSEDFNMCGAGLLFPEVCNTDVLRCKTGLFEAVTILHVMPLTRGEMDTIIERRRLGNPDWSEIFYPEDGAAFGKLPFLCARKR